MDTENLQNMGNKVYQLTIDNIPCQGGILEITLRNLGGIKTYMHPHTIPAMFQFCSLPHEVEDPSQSQNPFLETATAETYAISSMNATTNLTADQQGSTTEVEDVRASLMPSVETAPDENDSTTWMTVTVIATFAVVTALITGVVVHFAVVVRSRTPAAVVVQSNGMSEVNSARETYEVSLECGGQIDPNKQHQVEDEAISVESCSLNVPENTTKSS